MTVVNPKSISGINSITTGSGSDNLLTIHTSDASSTERVRINSSGDVIVGSGITVSPDGDIFATGVTTSTTFVGALTGNVTGNATGLSGTPNISAGTIAGSTGTFSGAVSGTTGTFSGAISGTTGTFTSHVSLGDSDQLRLGDSNDLVLQHNGTDSIIADTGTGDLYIRGSNDIFLQKGDGSETFMSATDDSGINLYHNNVNKFSTQSYGIAVDGVVTFTKDAADDTTSTIQVNGSSMTSTDYNYLMSASNDSGGNFLTMFVNGSGRSADGGNSGLTIRNDNGPMSVGLNGATHSNFFYTGAAGGIDFSGDGNTGGMTSELLDDYEEGTWTPVIQGTGANNAKTYQYQTGLYTKVGNKVTARFRVKWTNYSGNDTGNAIVNGLPFTANDASVSTGSLAGNNLNFPSSNHVTAAMEIENGDTYMYILATYDSAVWVNGGASTFWQSSGEIRGEMTYFTNS